MQSPFIELDNQGQVLRFNLDKDWHRLGRDRAWSDFEIPEKGWEVLSRQHAVFRREGKDYRLHDGDGQTPSRNGIFLHRTRISTTQGYVLENNVQLEIGQDPHNRILLAYINPTATQSQSRVVPAKPRLGLLGLQDWPVELGRSPNPKYASMQLDAPTVSRLHATIDRDGQGRYILQDHSTNGTFVNQRQVHRPVYLAEGDTIRMGPFVLLFRHQTLELFDRGNQIRLDAHQLLRQVPSKAGKKTILNQVSLAIEPGQLVALVGGSGAGKSTLMKTLLGIAPTTSGAVYLNGDNLQRHFNLYRSQIGYVPQDDIVHGDLTVEEVLTYACKLRLPPDTNVNEVIHRTLEQTKLSHVRTTFVRDLSGGQRKRVSIGVELLADPKLFFLDEPTSGLDPGLDKEMMNLLRELADQGRTIVLVTHATANIEVCDRIAFMGRGGRLCYFGPPQEAGTFFAMPSADLKYFADIYLKLEQGEAQVEHWAQQFLQSSPYQTYVVAPLSPGNTSQNTASPDPKTPPRNKQASLLGQWLLLSQRQLQLTLRDRFSLALALLTAPISIGLISIVLGEDNPLVKPETLAPEPAFLSLRVLFVFTCIAIWVGLSSAVQEIVKEASIYARERLVGLGLLPYIGSKLLIRSGLAILQTLLIVGAILLGFDPPAPELLSWPLGLGISTFLTLLANISLGLMVSSFVSNENQANNSLPPILIPQIIFSGVLFVMEAGSLASKLSWLTISRWSIAAYGALVNVNGMLPDVILDGTAEEPFPLDFYQTTWENFRLSWSLLLLHSTLYLVITLLQQKRKDIR